MTRQLAADGAQIVVLPEVCLQGYPAGAQSYSWEQIRAWASSPEDDDVQAFRDLAAELGIHLIAAYDRLDGDDLYNTAELIAPNGEVIGRYDKTHVLSGGDAGLYAPGRDLPVFETALGNIGILICNDRVYAESWRVLMLRGAEMVLIPSNGSYNEGNTRRLQTMALDNGVVCAFAHPKRGLVIDVGSRLLDHDEDDRRPHAIADADLSRVEAAQRGIRQRRRVDLYGDVMKA